MAQIDDAARFEAYWQAIEQTVCGVCLDRRDDGKCGLPGRRTCALRQHLPAVVEAISAIDSPKMDDYAAAVDSHICRVCAEQDGQGHCGPRGRGECALSAYLYLVTTAVLEANEAEARLQASLHS